MDKFNQLSAVIDEAREEAVKFYEKGNNAAGTRLRAKMLEITQLAKAVRVDVSEIKNAK